MTRSRASRTNNQLPTEVYPRLATPSESSRKLKAFTEHFFQNPFEWQGYVMDLFYLENDEGYLYDVGFSVARQNGKTKGILWPDALYSACVEGKKVIFSAHRGSVVMDCFMALKNMCSKSFMKGELYRTVKYIRSAQGQEGIYFKNGGFIRFYTRTRAGAVGDSTDKIYLDEAQYLTEEQMAAIAPTTVASAKQPQMIYAGTAPVYTDQGDPYRNLLEDARSGSNVSAFIGWISDHFEEKSGDVHRFNPSHLLIITDNAMDKERVRLKGGIRFATEHMNYWPERARAAQLFTQDHYDKTLDKTVPKVLGQHHFGVKVSFDGSMVALAEAAKDGDGDVFYQIVDYKNTGQGYQWIADVVSKRSTKAHVSVDGRSGCDAVIDRLRAAGVTRNVKRVPVSEATASASILYAKIRDGSARHPKQPQLEAVMTATVKRAIGNYGGWGFGLEGGSPDVSMIDACGLAVASASTSKAKKDVEVFAGWV